MQIAFSQPLNNDDLTEMQTNIIQSKYFGQRYACTHRTVCGNDFVYFSLILMEKLLRIRKTKHKYAC